MNYLAASSEVSLLRIINPTPQSGGELSPTFSSAEAGREGGLKRGLPAGYYPMMIN